jgi:hypothetical protein
MGMTAEMDLLSETNVEGTFFDPAYMLRWWEETRGALWHWSDWETAMEYRDLLFRKANEGHPWTQKSCPHC